MPSPFRSDRGDYYPIRGATRGEELSAKPMSLPAKRAQTRRARQAVPEGVAERWADVRGHRMRYLTAGQGPPVVLLHGLMGYSFSWSENLSDLARDFTVYAPDLFNTGWSDRIRQEGTLQCAAASVLDFMDAVGLDRAHVVGSSHGGTLALLLLAHAPQRVERVVAVSPASSVSEQRRWQARVFAHPAGALIGYALPYVAAFVHWYFISRMYADPRRILPGTIAGYNAPLKVKGTIPYLLNVMRCWRADFASLNDRLKGLDDSRLTFLWGEQDRVVRLDCVPEWKRLFPRARWVMMADAGHLPYEEHPAAFNQALRDCLEPR